jgi:hypothetical protein
MTQMGVVILSKIAHIGKQTYGRASGLRSPDIDRGRSVFLRPET